MVEAGTLCTNAQVETKSGANASATADAEAYTNIYILMAEAVVCAVTRYDWVTNYASLSSIGKELLRDVTSSLAAIYVITYDMSGYTSRVEAEDMINVHRDAALRGLGMLRDKKMQDWIV
jgi:hypothetical protein